MFKVLIPDRLAEPADIEREVFGPDFEVIVSSAKHASEIDDKTWGQVDAILAWHEIDYTKSLLRKLKNCKIIVRVGVGFDNVDLNAARKKNILVCNIPDYGTEDVADHAIALMLNLSRGISRHNESSKLLGSWSWKPFSSLKRLRGSTIGIIGLGRIGMAVGLRAKSFGLNVQFFDPYVLDGYDKSLGLQRLENISELLNTSDIVTIHTPLTEETRNLADESFFANMKDGAIFVNTARGEIVDSNSLLKALQMGKISGAGLDVLDVEPPNPVSDLVKYWKETPANKNKLIITPHCAFYNQASYIEMRQKAALEAKRVLTGQKPKNPLN